MDTGKSTIMRGVSSPCQIPHPARLSQQRTYGGKMSVGP